MKATHGEDPLLVVALFARGGSIPLEVLRAELRQAKQFALADFVRERLGALGAVRLSSPLGE